MNRDALVVGINSYTHLSPLKAPAGDAEAIAQRLEQNGEFRVWRLPEVIDQGASKVGKTTLVSAVELEQALVQLFLPQGKSLPDTALFYFSGHGLRKTLGIQEGYLATSAVNPNQDLWGLRLKWLRELLQESPIHKKVIWLDCCHSGELLNFGEADPGVYGEGQNRCFIAASREHQVAYEDISSPHSVLTQALLDGLDPTRYPTRWIDNFALADFINQSLRGSIQSPICQNSGEPINLTRHWQVSTTSTTAKAPSTVCPYKGLAFFDCNEEDPKYFYGRTALTDQLLDKVRQGNFLAIVGASGSGKSSVLRAGLIHQLKLGQRVSGSDQWQIKVMLPGAHPLRNLAFTFVDTSRPSLERAEQLGKAEGLIREGSEGLRRLVQTAGTSRIVLVIDQFEESFTLCQDVSERQRFFQCLLDALSLTENKLCLVLAMRADFFSKCLEQNYSGLARQIQNYMVAVTPLNREELQTAIVEPAKQVDLLIEPELVKQMMTDVEGAPGILPLLQYTLAELWKQQSDGQLRLREYSNMGGVTGTLQQRATAIYEDFPKEQQATVKHVFLALTQLGDGTEDTRRRVLKPDLVNTFHSAGQVDEVIQKLADEKLVVTSEVMSKSAPSERLTVVDVAHEALIRHWALLRKWLDESRDVLRQARKLEASAQEWRDEGRKQNYLLLGWQITGATRFRQEHAHEQPFSPLVEEFIQKSLRERDIRRLQLASWLIIPAIGVLLLVEAGLRENQVGQYLQDLKGSKEEQRRAVIALEEGCEQTIVNGWIPSYIAERLFGNCRDDLEGTHLENANLEGVYLENAHLEGVYLENAHLENAHLENAHLENAHLENAYLRGAYLRGAKLRGAIFQSAHLENADLRDVTPGRDGSEIVSFLSAHLEGANLKNAYLEKAQLQGANFQSAHLERVHLKDAYLGSTHLEDADLEDADLDQANLQDAYLDGAHLESASMLNTNLRHAHFVKTNLTSTKLCGANFLGVDLRNANLTHAHLKAGLYNGSTQFSQGISPKKQKMYLVGPKANLRGADLMHVYLNGVKISSADLTGANLLGAKLEAADLTGANLSGANLKTANLIGAIGASLEKAYLCQTTMLPNVKSDRDCKKNWIHQTVDSCDE